MHPQNTHTSRRRWLSGLAIVAAGGLCATAALAQQPAPGGMPAAGAPAAASSATQSDYSIIVGETILVRSPSGKNLTQVVASRPSILEIEPIDPKQPNVIRVKGKAVGTSQLSLTDEGGSITVLVSVNPDLADVQQALEKQFPRANIKLAEGVSGQQGVRTLVVTGHVESAEDVDPILTFLQGYVGGANVVNGIRVVGVMQVQLEVCIGRVRRSEARQMNFAFTTSENNWLAGNILSGLLPQPIVARNTVSQTVPPGFVAGGGNTATVPNGNFFFGTFDTNSAFMGFLQALRVEGLVKVLAEPTLVTMSGRPASFLAGGETPVPVPTGIAGGGQVGIEYKEFGVLLQFLPVVLGDGKIRLTVAPEISNIAGVSNISGFPVPSFETNRVATTVELESGQTFAIGGLIQNQLRASTTKVPILGDLPVLGAAFRAVDYNEEESELLVLVTPYLVDPLDASQRQGLKLPGQETRTPTDFELFLEGILEAPRGPREICPNGRYRAAYLQGGSCGTDCGANGCSLPTGSLNGAVMETASSPALAPAAKAAPETKLENKVLVKPASVTLLDDEEEVLPPANPPVDVPRLVLPPLKPVEPVKRP